MRSSDNTGGYGTSAINPYNSNDRGQSSGSDRNYYSGDFGPADRERRLARTSGGNSNRNSFSNSGYSGSSSDSGRSGGYGSSDDNYNYGSSSNRYGNDRNRSGSNFGSSSYGSSNYGSGDRYSNNRNRHDDDNWWENTKDKMSNAWDDVTGDDDNNYRNRNQNFRSSGRGYDSGSSYSGRYGSDNDYGSSNYYRSGSSQSYGSGSLGSGATGYGSGSSFGNDSGQGNSNYGSSSYGSSDRGRYSSGSDRNRFSSDYDRNNSGSFGRNRDHDDDRGFFDRAGDEVKSWFGDDEAERRRRSDEARDRSREYGSDRYGSNSGGSTYNGPPYSYGSSSRRGYEW